MKKLTSLFLAVAMLAGLLFSIPSYAAEEESTALEVAKAIGYGWNLGNTMEACGTWLENASVSECETAWGAPITTAESVKKLADYGYGAVRIPVAWSNLMADDGKYQINEELLDRVEEIIGYVIDSGMYAIVNIHWDGGWWDNFGGSKTEAAEAMKKYKTIWKQISKRYKNIGQKLILESANEELGGFNLRPQDAFDKVNEINQAFVDTVRAAGGENKNRFLLIAGYNTGIDKTCSDKFIMPTDTVKNHLFISIHYYGPSTYCIAETEDNSWGYLDSWGSEQDKLEMWNELIKMKKFTDEGYGVIIGEYGVCKKKTADGKVVTKDGTDVFVDTMLSMSLQLGYVPCLWDVGNPENNTYDRRAMGFAEEAIGTVFEKYGELKAQSISGVSKQYAKIFAEGKSFTLKPTVKTGAKLSFVSSDESIATVSSSGKVTLKNVGVALITVKAAATGKYRETVKYITLIVKPANAKLTSVEYVADNKAKVSAEFGIVGASGMEILYSENADMSGAITETVNLNANNCPKVLSRVVKGLSSGKKYYFRARYFVKYNDVKYYGGWSAKKALTIS